MHARKTGLLLAPALALASCRTPPPPHVAPAPPVVRLPPPSAVATDWRDLPLTPGGWRYAQEGADSSASFGPAGSPPELVIRCLRAARMVTLVRRGAAGPLAVRTSYSTRSLSAPGGIASLDATDTFLDGIAFSRGRFTIEAAGMAMLVAPAWAEPGRVIEDCRS